MICFSTVLSALYIAVLLAWHTANSTEEVGSGSLGVCSTSQ